MVALIIPIVIAVLCLIMSIFLFRGKGSFLIAGYNTASPEEKSKFDEKKLCKVVGIILLVVSLLLFAMAFFTYQLELDAITENEFLIFGGVFFVTIIATVVFAIVYSNTKCKR